MPTKSGVSGGLMTVIPGIGSFASWSPPLNEEGNCVRGIGMIEKLSEIYVNINLFHKDRNKRDFTKKLTKLLSKQLSLAAHLHFQVILSPFKDFMPKDKI